MCLNFRENLKCIKRQINNRVLFFSSMKELKIFQSKQKGVNGILDVREAKNWSWSHRWCKAMHKKHL